jgi:ABC-2 type transport system ATP-binding protein
MRELILALAPNKAIVVSTHILEEVEAICSRALIVARGRMLIDATPADLLAMAPDAQAAVAPKIETGHHSPLDAVFRHITREHLDH